MSSGNYQTREAEHVKQIHKNNADKPESRSDLTFCCHHRNRSLRKEEQTCTKPSKLKPTIKIQQECHKIPGEHQDSRRAPCHTGRFSTLRSENLRLVLTARPERKGSLPGSRGWLGQERPGRSLPRGPHSAGAFWPLCSSQTTLLHYADVTRWPPNTASSYCSARPQGRPSTSLMVWL